MYLLLRTYVPVLWRITTASQVPNDIALLCVTVLLAIQMRGNLGGSMMLLGQVITHLKLMLKLLLPLQLKLLQSDLRLPQQLQGLAQCRYGRVLSAFDVWSDTWTTNSLPGTAESGLIPSSCSVGRAWLKLWLCFPCIWSSVASQIQTHNHSCDGAAIRLGILCLPLNLQTKMCAGQFMPYFCSAHCSLYKLQALTVMNAGLLIIAVASRKSCCCPFFSFTFHIRAPC